MITPFEAMQNAVDIVLTSEHRKNKIAACLFNETSQISTCNRRPNKLNNAFPPETRIGNSSQFIHAEVACIFDFPEKIQGTSICITDPMCPNCAKAICESGIKHVYIDHKGMEKDFVVRRGDDFKKISLKILENAGVLVSVIYRRDKIIKPLINAKTIKTTDVNIEKTNNISTCNQDLLNQFIKSKLDRSFAFAKIKNNDEIHIIYVPELIYTIDTDGYKSKKYRNIIDPINRLLFHVKQNNYTIINNEIICNLYPSSRDLVNAVGFGINQITTASNIPDHDKDGDVAASILQKNGIITLNTV